MEGCIEGVTGWAIDNGNKAASSQDVVSLYDKLQDIIIPMFYHSRDKYIDVMRQAIAVNGSFFITQRMLQQYAQKAHF